MFTPCFGWICLLSGPGQSRQLPLQLPGPGQQNYCSCTAQAWPKPGCWKAAVLQQGRHWVAWGCRAGGASCSQGKGAVRGPKLSTAVAPASTFPPSLGDGRAGCWSSRAPAPIIHLLVCTAGLYPWKLPAPVLPSAASVRGPWPQFCWKAAKFSTERP